MHHAGLVLKEHGVLVLHLVQLVQGSEHAIFHAHEDDGTFSMLLENLFNTGRQSVRPDFAKKNVNLAMFNECINRTPGGYLYTVLPSS